MCNCFESWMPFLCGQCALKVLDHTCANQRSSSNSTWRTITTPTNCQMPHPPPTCNYMYMYMCIHVHVHTCSCILYHYSICNAFLYMCWVVLCGPSIPSHTCQCPHRPTLSFTEFCPNGHFFGILVTSCMNVMYYVMVHGWYVVCFLVCVHVCVPAVSEDEVKVLQGDRIVSLKESTNR